MFNRLIRFLGISIIVTILIFLLQVEPAPGEIDNTAWSYASFPVVKFSEYSSPFGERIQPCPTCSKFHKGLDIAAPNGSEMRAWWGGKVIEVGFDPNGWGNYLVIVSGKWEHLYAHCESILVKKGQTVKTKDLIAKVGETGGATGPHLHWELRHQTKEQEQVTDSSQWELINPAEVLWRMYRAQYPEKADVSKVSFQTNPHVDKGLETY